jgi:hypothetical protein
MIEKTFEKVAKLTTRKNLKFIIFFLVRNYFQTRMGDENLTKIDINALVIKAVGEFVQPEFFSTKPILQFTTNYVKPVSEMIQAALIAVLKEVKKVHDEELASLNAKIDQINAKISNQPKSSSQSQPSGHVMSYSSLFTKTKQSETEVVLLAKVKSELQSQSKIEKNVIVSGLPAGSTEEDESQVNELLAVLGIEKEKVKRKTRLRKSAAVSLKRPTEPALLLIEFDDISTKSIAIENAKSFRKHHKFHGVYLNSDKTAAEREIDGKLRQERNKRNAKLPNVMTIRGKDRRYGVESDGKKYFWGIIGSRLVHFTLYEDEFENENSTAIGGDGSS